MQWAQTLRIHTVNKNELKPMLEQMIQNANQEKRRSVKSPEPLNQTERDAVYYFFAKLKLFDPIRYDQIMPDAKSEKATKTEYANSIRGFTKLQIDFGFGELKKLVGLNDPDYKFLTVARIVGFIANGGNCEPPRAGMYKLDPPVVKPTNAIGSSIEAMRAKSVEVLNPTTGEYGIAVASPKSTLSKSDKFQAEETLKKLNSLFDD